jgi:DNA polymerase/3'-5' exonuclease PolX
MSNTAIVNNFMKLINYVQSQIDTLKTNKSNAKELTANIFRLKQLKNVLIIIKKYPNEISKDNLSDFAELPGIGKGTIDRITEILENGKLSELKNFKDDTVNNMKIIDDLETIVGVGRSLALDFINMGITSVEDLKKKVAKGTIEVNDKVLLGIKYYGVFKGDIPRNEITEIYNLLHYIINKMNKHYKLDETNKYIFEICGSYRREKEKSGDIDVLVSKLGTTEDSEDINHLERFVKRLKKNLKLNNNNPLLVDDMTDKNYETKYMGFAKYKDNFVRRIDIRFITYDSYHSALLYFTGSADLNKKMRQIAKTMGYKLSEYGLTKISDNKKVSIKSEEDVFKILKMEYLSPKLR